MNEAGVIDKAKVMQGEIVGKETEEMPRGSESVSWQEEEVVASTSRPRRVINRPSRYLE